MEPHEIGTRIYCRGDYDDCTSFSVGRTLPIFFSNNIIITRDFGNILDGDDNDIHRIMYSRRSLSFPTRNPIAIRSHVLLGERKQKLLLRNFDTTLILLLNRISLDQYFVYFFM